jgi:hypothetical protein
MNKLARPITPDEVRAYQISGVVHLRGILDLATVNSLRRCIDEAVETLGESASGYNLTSLTSAVECNDAETLRAHSDGQHDVAAIVDYIKQSGKPLLLDGKTKADGAFFLDTGVAARHRNFQRVCAQGVMPEIAAALLGADRVNFFGDQIFIKEPGTRGQTAFHQDASYFEIEGDECCVMWIPVDPVKAETGGMKYWRGSHHRKEIYAPNVFVSQTPLPGSEGKLLPDIEGHLEDFDIVQFDVEPGDILVHHYRTVHGAGANLSRYQVRRAASLRYCGDDIRFKSRPWAPRQLHHTTRLQDGDPLSGPDFPVVWTRKRSNEAA